jgi:hypothetical protein
MVVMGSDESSNYSLEYTNDTYKRLPDHAGRHHYQSPDPNEILGDRLPYARSSEKAKGDPSVAQPAQSLSSTTREGRERGGDGFRGRRAVGTDETCGMICFHRTGKPPSYG